jgi:hypothetical protein
MKRTIVWTMFFIAMLVMSLAAVAKDNKDRDRDECTCSNATVAGTWGTTMTGTLFNPATGAAGLFAAVNFATYDGEGTYWGTQTRNNNGTFSRAYFEGTYTVNSDCTGKKTTSGYADAGHTILLNTVDQDFVLVNDAKELIEIFSTLTLPNGVVVPAVVTGHSTRQFPESDNLGRHLGNCRR